MSSLQETLRELRLLEEQRAAARLDESGERRLQDLHAYLESAYPNGVPPDAWPPSESGGYEEPLPAGPGAHGDAGPEPNTHHAETGYEHFVAEAQLQAGDAYDVGAHDSSLSSTFMDGEHRVAVHMLSGTVQRGRIVDTDLDSAELLLYPVVGTGEPVVIPVEQVQALFFVPGPADPPPEPVGEEVVVCFSARRSLRGHGDFLGEGAPGFFFLPESDSRRRAAWAFVYHHGVEVMAG